MVDADTDWTKTKEMPWAGGMAVWPTALGACREDTHFQFAPTTLLLMLTLLHLHVEGRVRNRISMQTGPPLLTMLVTRRTPAGERDRQMQHYAIASYT